MSGAPLFSPSPTRAELEAHVRTLAMDTRRLNFEAPHFQLRLVERGILMRQVLDILRTGAAIAGPTKDGWGDWRIEMKAVTAGSPVQVVVRPNEIVAITVI